MPPRTRLIDLVGSLDPDETRTFIAALSAEEARAAEADWYAWAHAGQTAPRGAWRAWVIMAGRGFGKTRAGAEWIAHAVRHGDSTLRIALVAASFEEARRVMVEGESGLLKVADDLIDSWVPTNRCLRFIGGAQAELFSGGWPRGLRGPEHHLAWCDELAKWRHGTETWDTLQLGLRLGTNPRVLVTTTPRPCEALRRALAAAGPNVTGGATTRNPHLPPAFVDAVTGMYKGTRLGRQELDGELLPDVAGALWSVELLEKCRLPSPQWGEGRPVLVRSVIGVDPPSGDGTCGIVACATDEAGTAYVLADHSVTARSPEGWARAVAAAADTHAASLVVAEANQGGRMVETVLRAAGVGAKVKLVHAAQGKSARADPIATLFEAGKVRLAGRFDALEAELRGLVGGGGYQGPGRSPDRADAMVWALTELMLGTPRAAPLVRAL